MPILHLPSNPILLGSQLSPYSLHDLNSLTNWHAFPLYKQSSPNYSHVSYESAMPLQSPGP